MVRLIAFLIGLFLSGWLLVSAGVTTYGMITEPAAETVEAQIPQASQAVSFKHDGPFGQL